MDKISITKAEYTFYRAKADEFNLTMLESFLSFKPTKEELEYYEILEELDKSFPDIKEV